MMWKLNPLLPCAATIVTLAIAPAAQAVRLIPTPTVTDFQFTNPAATSPKVEDNLPQAGNGAVEGDGISVEITSDRSDVYKLCFEYGSFNFLYDPTRTEICNDFMDNPAFDNSQTGGDFLNLPNLTFAERAMGNANPPLPDDPVSDGLRTALVNSGVIRGVGDSNPGVDPAIIIFDSIVPRASTRIYLPYETASNGLGGVFLEYDGSSWSGLQRDNNLSDTTPFLFMRLQFTGSVDPTALVPEPSGIFGILAVGLSLGLSGWKKGKSKK